MSHAILWYRSPFLEIGLFAAQDVYLTPKGETEHVPAAGLIVGIGRVSG